MNENREKCSQKPFGIPKIRGTIQIPPQKIKKKGECTEDRAGYPSITYFQKKRSTPSTAVQRGICGQKTPPWVSCSSNHSVQDYVE